MAHGWGGVQDALTTPFYPRFLEAGFAVMTFDYHGWGESKGQPRQVIDPQCREQDIEQALSHLKAQAQIDAARIVLWGTSFGGGHAVSVGSKHPELLGIIAQVPMLDGMAAVLATPLPRLLRFGIYAGLDLLRGGKPLYIPVISAQGAFSSMDRDGAEAALHRDIERVGISYDNRVAARSLLTMGPYRPFKALANIKVPTLLIGATRDTVAPFVEKKIRAIGNPCLRLETLDANHFDPYFEPAFSVNIGHQLSFLRQLGR
ncbi:putative Hydrolase, alpha/beta fold family [Sterolibacterium denitrificans]|uniref:Putative Hydrolase, alpha/beta fold family n=2 Tax=Sterolibacterium denitrificans TaxID=157592 RepID=A0A7Z7HPM6_9PROT|nr:putative Hydrolase, alpha/beta fold family [Sterolibacterium denitrificans]SMB25780.1 putative Hydrolase, alpha/beta fold family [Sterolibacterium denitrificans]